MSESFETDMRKRLIELREELEAVAATGDESSQVVELDQTRQGRLSRMDAMQAQAMSQESARRREMTLKNIAAAIARLDDGTFGLCQSCDEPINRKRLEFDPTARLCIQCAEEAER